jgi:hypothetical protein
MKQIRLSKKDVIVVIVLIIVAGAMRLYKLDTWSFANDEVATIHETDVLFGKGTAPEESPQWRLPRVNCLAYAFHYAGDSIAGRSEFGARLVPAVFGILSIGILYILLRKLTSISLAVTASVLVMLWPCHLFHSQQARNYVIAFFFATGCTLLGAYVLKRRSVTATVLLGVFAVCLVLTHALMGFVWGAILAAIVLGSLIQRRMLPKAIVGLFALETAVLLAILFCHILPLARGWNSSATFGYEPFHAALSAVHLLSWPVFLLAALGAIICSVEIKKPLYAYWLVCGICWGLAVLVLPQVVVLHPGYFFPFAIAPIILAAVAITRIFQLLSESHLIVAIAWVCVACSFNLPSVVSHYKDGTRHDIRSAAACVRENWREGDRVTTMFAPRTHELYAPNCTPCIPLSLAGPVTHLQQLQLEEGRLWIVALGYRGGVPEDLRYWLAKNATFVHRAYRKRFDYSEYSVEVHLLGGNHGDQNDY